MGRNVRLISYYPRIIPFLEYNPIAIGETTMGGLVLVYRCEKGLSQKRLAKMLDVDAKTVELWEDKKKFPRDEVLSKLS